MMACELLPYFSTIYFALAYIILLLGFIPVVFFKLKNRPASIALKIIVYTPSAVASYAIFSRIEITRTITCL